MAKALVLYHSQEFGNTAIMAEAVAEGLRDAGCEVDLFNTNEGRFNMVDFPGYDCVAFGSPDYYGYIAGGLKTFMDDHYIYDVRKGLKGIIEKSYVLFYSHGGGGKVKDVMQRIFRRIGTLIGEPVGSNGRPDQQVLNRCKALGSELAESILL
ncbi:MAG: flavodoxin domain-containing protein [Dehalococcoidales bacterium]|nr:flavodoxin domain-containing protein [Dehalococcoidales bacterium]